MRLGLVIGGTLGGIEVDAGRNRVSFLVTTSTLIITGASLGGPRGRFRLIRSSVPLGGSGTSGTSGTGQ